MIANAIPSAGDLDTRNNAGVDGTLHQAVIAESKPFVQDMGEDGLSSRDEGCAELFSLIPSCFPQTLSLRFRAHYPCFFVGFVVECRRLCSN